ncbi:MAG: LysR family transcriptional regulator [Acetobacteraceae bacterium]|nr:LysR family transcriptional regulator [Acetobacteraceae bacterium]
MTNLRSLDLNLLLVFEAVFEAGSITRAAERLALSASATSHALGRLRNACRDDLFVRVGQGIAPTPVATRIYPDIRKALDALRRSVAEAQGFDPVTSTRRFELAIPHPLGPIWALAVRERALAEAPGVQLRFDTRTLPIEPRERMRAGELDMLVDWIPSVDERFVQRKLLDDALVLVARSGHPRIQPGIRMAALEREEFVRTHRRSGPTPEGIATLLEALPENATNAPLLVSEFLEVPYVVAHTDLLGFIPRTMTQRAVRDFGLQLIPLPVASLPVPIWLIWHETRRADDGHRWLRGLVAETISTLADPG